MKYSMKLSAQTYRMVRSGQQTIVLRLDDEEQRQLQVNDAILCVCPEEGQEPLEARVKALHRFPNFAKLYAALPLLKCGYTQENLAAAGPEDQNQFYSQEEQERYGVVGIELRLRHPEGNAKRRASMFLSMVLRHRPQEAGITLDAHGWADVDQLLQGINKRFPLTEEQLEDIVRTDEKQRYSFNSDKTRIRANQGHSIPVDVELAPCEPPEVLYHGTGEKYQKSILEKGLIPKTRLYVHLSQDVETAKAVGIRHGTPIVFMVQSGQMYRDGFRFYRSVNGVWLTYLVPPAYLKKME